MKNIKRLALAAIVAIAAIQVSIAPQAAFAGAPATITVNTTKDDLNYDDNLCSLREAMRRAFDNDSTAMAQNDCTQSTGGSTTIKFGISGSIAISTGIGLGTLPHVINRVTLIGPITIDGKLLDQQLFVSHSDAIFSLVNVTVKNAKWTAISNEGGKLQISGGKFENNSAGGAGGGAIRTSGETIIAGTAFTNNKAVRKDNGEATKDGGAIRSTWKLTIAGATFTGNVADGQGGAIMAQSHSFEIADSAFTANVANGLPHDLDHNGDGGTYGSGGGAISFAASGNTYPSAIQRTAFQANVSLNGSGGAVFHNGSTQLTISDSSFQANHAGTPAAKGAGGAIFNVSELIVKRSSFTGNSVDGDGGALANDLGGQVKLRVAGFAANNASGKGGALLNSNLTGSEAKFDMLGVQVTGNVAGNAGGGIYNYDSKYDTAAVRGSVWAGNLPENCKDKQTSDEATPDPGDEEVWPVDSKGQNYFSDQSCDADEDEDDKNPGDPGFNPDPQLEAPAANGGVPGLLTQMPLIGSPLVDAIAPDKASQDPEDQKDMRGMPRGMNGTGFGAGFWDIGPFERDDAAPKFSSLPVSGGTIHVGSGSVGSPFTKTAALKIYNGGDLDLTLTGAVIGGAHPADFALTLVNSVAPNGSASISIACSPAAAGDRTATLAFNTNDPAKPSANYTLTCKGNVGAFPVLDSTPANGGLSSIETKVGLAGNLVISFRNKGTANLSFAGAVLTADPVGGISSVGSPVPGVLAPGSSASTQLYPCDTSSTGIKTARLTFTTNEAGNPTRFIDLVCTVNKAPDPLFGEHDSDTGGYGTVAGPYGIAISPDGRHVYAADEGDSTIIVNSVNPSTHMLDAASVFESSSLSVSNRFTSTYQVMVSPDGRFVYATGFTGDSLATFTRDAESGALSHVDTVRQGSGYNCTGIFPPICANTVTGMNGAYGMALSPDGKFIYVSSVHDDSIVVFGRDPETGAASSTRLGGSGAFFKQQFTHANLNGAYGMVMSPDGANVYVTGYLSDALITLKRDPVNGTLSHQAALFPVDAAGLDGVFRVSISADGRFLYTASFDSNSLCAFSRNTLTGVLAPINCYTSPHLTQASDVVLSPDGKRVFVTGYGSSSLLAFARNEDTGGLSFTDVISNGSGAKIAGARGVVIHPADDAAYVTGNTDDRVVAIRFNQPTPQLNAVSPASVVAGGTAFALTVKGKDFQPNSYVMLDGVQKPTQYLNSETLVATIDAAGIAVPAEKDISVFTPPAGGGLSELRKLYIVAAGATPVPVIEEINLGGIPAGAISATVDVKGTGFSPSALVIANGSGRSTSYVSDKLLRATLIAADLENIGTLVISVDNAPAMTAQSVESVPSESAQVAVGSEEAVMDAGGDEMPLVQPVQAAAAPLQSQSASVAPSESNVVGIQVVAPNTNPAPGISALSPDNAQAQGSAAQLVVTITGNRFVLGAQAYWNGEARATEFVNATTVKMTISAGDLLFGGTADVSVVNPSPGGGESSVLTFTIVEPPPQAFFYKTRLPLVRRG